MPLVPASWPGGGASSSVGLTYDPTPLSQKLLAWSYDPVMADQGATQNLGLLVLVRIEIPVAMTVTNLVAWVAAAMVTPTGVCAGALYDGSGHQTGGGVGVKIAHTGDMSAVWTTTGQKVMPLTAEAGASLTLVGGLGVWLYAATLEVGGASSVGFAQAPNSGHNNIGLAAADGYRFAQLGGQVGLPNSVTLAGLAETSRPNWHGLS